MNVRQYCKAIGFGAICAVGSIELLLHAFPVKSSHQFMPNDRDTPVRQAQATSLVEPIDWKFSNSVERRINNYGFVDDSDYAAGEDSIAVIGDSFIQSAMLPYQSTLQGNLQRQLGNKTRVYSYGIPGYSLAGYVGAAEYASKNFKPKAFVFLITQGDLSDSLESWGGSYYLDKDLKLEFKESDASKAQQILSHSRLFRYLQKQLYVNSHDFSPFGKAKAKDSGKNNPSLSSERLQQLSHKLLDYLGEKSAATPDNTVFIIDGDRDAIYGRKAQAERAELLTFKKIAKSRGYRTIDAHPVFNEYYQTTKKQLDFSPTDFHWNEAAFDTISQTVYPSVVEIIDRQIEPAPNTNTKNKADLATIDRTKNPQLATAIPILMTNNQRNSPPSIQPAKSDRGNAPTESKIAEKPRSTRCKMSKKP
jgi:hypothetical protein